MVFFAKNRFLLSIFALTLPVSSLSAKTGVSVPEEYESVGGHAMAYGGSVSSGLGGASAVRSNPSLLALDKEYSVTGAYHWPVAGRDFYQVGVVDSKTSSVAAGFSYTGALDDYRGAANERAKEPEDMRSLDTPVVRRMNIAFAQSLGKVLAGVSGSYVEAALPETTLREGEGERITGITLGGGVSAYLTRTIRIGLSAENLANRKVRFASPTFYRAGASWFVSDLVAINLDWRRREAVEQYEGKPSSLGLANGDQGKDAVAAENLYVLSGSARVFDLLRVIMSAGQANTSLTRRTQVAGGLALVNKKFVFSYQALRPDMAVDAIHHGLALGLDIAL